MESLAQHLVIVGATASGKSEVAIDLANRFHPKSEIISLDSMQIYQGMEIGTGVIEFDKRKGIIHHMLSVLEPTTEQSVKQFQDSVYSLLDSTPQKKYILVGGTGLYTHAIVDGFKFAPTDKTKRTIIIDEYYLDEENPDPESVARAYEYLCEVDKTAAQKIDPSNVRRIVRALEAIEISGGKFSDSGMGVQNFGKPVFDVKMFGLRFSRDLLKRRIVHRVEAMLDSGWIEEVKLLIKQWDKITPPAKNAIGYAILTDWINRGENQSELSQVKELIINKTVQFSRRQRKWFERDPRIVWIECDDLGKDEISQQIWLRATNSI